MHICSFSYYLRFIIPNELIPALLSGDPQAFRQIVEHYQPKVFNTAISLVQDHGMAEDIAQEVFITVYRSIPSFNEQSSLATWIYRITVNKSLDHLRAQKRIKRNGIFNQLFHKNTGELLHDKTDFLHPGIQLENKEKAQYLFAAINTLPENQRTVFVLAHIEELPQREIAAIMDLSLKAVESLLQRAKGNLRKRLGSLYDRRKIE